MIAILDVQYLPDGSATAACVLANAWPDAEPADVRSVRVPTVAAYEPGQFYKRELPCLLAVLATLARPPTTCVVDGYCWLGGQSLPGLGAHLRSALGGGIPVVGIGKTRYAGAAPVVAVTRGRSANPLYISAAGLPLEEAVAHVRSMHGPHRLPTLVGRADALSRRAPAPSPAHTPSPGPP